VGAPYSAAEMVNIEFIVRDVAAGMAERYCAAPGDGHAKRAAAWRPWSGLGGVAKSEALLQEMVGKGRPAFSTIGLVGGIENTGGMSARTCVFAGEELPCHYVNPAKAQGRLVGHGRSQRGSGRHWQGPADRALLRARAQGSRRAPLAEGGHGLRGRHPGPPAAGPERPARGPPAGVGSAVDRGTDLGDTSRPRMGCGPQPGAPGRGEGKGRKQAEPLVSRFAVGKGLALSTPHP
jgi:hypothetical protein